GAWCPAACRSRPGRAAAGRTFIRRVLNRPDAGWRSFLWQRFGATASRGTWLFRCCLGRTRRAGPVRGLLGTATSRRARLLRRRLGRTGRSTAGRTVLRYGIVGSALRRAGALWFLCPRWAWTARRARTARRAARTRGSWPRRPGTGTRRTVGWPTARGRVLPVVVRLLLPPLHHDLVRASVVRHRHRHRMP